MNKKMEKLLPWLLSILIIISIAATSKQLIGPTAATTDKAIVRWNGTDAWKTTNSVVTISDAGNLSGVNVQTMNQVEAVTGYVTNGIIYIQQSTTPTAGQIGGTVGSVTNYMIRNVNGVLMKYYSDGVTIRSQEIGTH